MDVAVRCRHLDIPAELQPDSAREGEPSRAIPRRDPTGGGPLLAGPRPRVTRVTCAAKSWSSPGAVRARSGERAPRERRARGGTEQGGTPVDTHEGPARAALAAPSRHSWPPAGGDAGLTASESPLAARVAIVGATGTGKTALALELARSNPGRYELVSVDAMAVYRFLDRGTAKPTPAERAAAPWHLLDIVDPSEEFSVAAFQRHAREALAAIECRGNVPVLVGGTGLYHRAVVDELEIPGRFPDVAAELGGTRTGRAGSRNCSSDFTSWTRSPPVGSGRATGEGSSAPSRSPSGADGSSPPSAPVLSPTPRLARS